MPHLAFWAVAVLLCGGAAAEENGSDGKGANGANVGVPSPSIATSLPPQLADPDGIRKELAERGVTFKLNYTGEVLGNVAGGLRRGAIYDGQIEFAFDVDLSETVGWKGATVHANAFQIQGERLTPKYVGSLDVISSIEALATIRLYEAWIQQKFFGDMLSVKLGQLGVDAEFHVSATALHFVNNTFGWPTINSVDLPSGGPSYPLATPGIRVRIDPDPSFALLAAVFDGNPAGPGESDPQERDRYGVNFRVSDPPLWVGEAQYQYNQSKGAAGLPGIVKFGSWYHSGAFDKLTSATAGQMPNVGSGNPGKVRGNWGIFGVLDQQVWRLPGGDAEKGANVFARISGSPSDRNVVNLYIDGGITFTGVVPRRPDDAFGVAVAYNRISGDLSAPADDAVVAARRRGVPDNETLLELTYQAQIVPGWILQPDFQYIWHPASNAQSSGTPNFPAIPNAAVIGLRTVVNY